MMKKLASYFQKFPVLDKNGKFLGKYDIFVPLLVIILVILGLFSARVVFQKDTYVTAELFASGGEWWWNNPAPPHWLTDPIQPGAKEYDAQGNVLVDVLDTKKFEAGDRKMLWMKVRLRVTPMKGAKQYRFRLEPIQVGSLIYVAPSNVRIASNVMWIEGISEDRKESQKVITIEEYNIFPWLADAVSVGDAMRADDGTVLAEVVEKNVRQSASDIVELDGGAMWDKSTGRPSVLNATGRLRVIPNDTRRDITLKLRVKTTVSKGRDYFSYFQPLKVGFYIWIPLEKVNISGNIINVE